MSFSTPVLWLALAAAGICGTAAAQGGSSAPAAAAPAYQSVLQDYRRFTDQKVAPWAESNATVSEVGGWRAYAKEAGESPQAAPADARPSGDAAPAGAHKH